MLTGTHECLPFTSYCKPYCETTWLVIVPRIAFGGWGACSHVCAGAYTHGDLGTTSGALSWMLSSLDFVIWSLTEPWGSNSVFVSRLQAYATIHGFHCLGSGVQHWSSCFPGGPFTAISQSMDCFKKNTIILWIDQLHCIVFSFEWMSFSNLYIQNVQYQFHS